jgi:uncharacterized protein YndB with AHSA1/START domain
MDGIYFDIVQNERIVYAYTKDMDGVRISASLASVELTPAGDAKTRLRLTEHGIYFDGKDSAAEREMGTRGLLEKLVAAV